MMRKWVLYLYHLTYMELSHSQTQTIACECGSPDLRDSVAFDAGRRRAPKRCQSALCACHPPSMYRYELAKPWPVQLLTSARFTPGSIGPPRPTGPNVCAKIPYKGYKRSSVKVPCKDPL
jgi:hypothetical protein